MVEPLFKKKRGQRFRKDLDPRIKEMMSLAVKIRHYVTETVLDSFILEANLIKSIGPNTTFSGKKDDRSLFISLSPKRIIPSDYWGYKEPENFPAVPRIFGPYKSLRIAREILKIARRIFSVWNSASSNQGKLCFPLSNRFMSRHLAPGCFQERLSKKHKQSDFVFKRRKKENIKKLTKR